MRANSGVSDAVEQPTDRVRRVDAQRNLEAIVEAAVPLLSDRPRASMQQIATAAGLHRATVHRHFPSRDDLLDELRRRAVDTSVAELAVVMASPSADPGDTLERATAALIGVGDLYRLHRFTTWRSPASEEAAGELGERLMELLAAARAAGQIRVDLPIGHIGVAYGGLLVAMIPPVGEGTFTAEQAARTVRTLLAAPPC